jgi:hypothetical protein
MDEDEQGSLGHLRRLVHLDSPISGVGAHKMLILCANISSECMK